MAELFPFKFFDSIRGRWIQARYKATPEEIAARYEKWEITGLSIFRRSLQESKLKGSRPWSELRAER